MSRGVPRLELSRAQVLRFRRRAGFLDTRLPAGPESLRQAAFAGLQDSMPRAALLSIHGRVAGTRPGGWEHPALVQLWGPRFSAYVVAAEDLAVFSLGRLPEEPRARARAGNTAERLRLALDGQRLPFGQAGRAMGVVPNSLRYAAATGTVLLRWDGARQPLIWTVPPPAMEPIQARLELARRFLHVFGPSTDAAFAKWAGIRGAEAHRAFQALGGELAPTRTETGADWILAVDEVGFRAKASPAAPARLLPSGDTYFLMWGADRALLVPDARQRAALWTSRVWPGALLMNGEIAGTWRRAGGTVSVEPWRRFTPAEQAAVEREAADLPLGLEEAITVRWEW